MDRLGYGGPELRRAGAIDHVTGIAIPTKVVGE